MNNIFKFSCSKFFFFFNRILERWFHLAPMLVRSHVLFVVDGWNVVDLSRLCSWECAQLLCASCWSRENGVQGGQNAQAVERGALSHSGYNAAIRNLGQIVLGHQFLFNVRSTARRERSTNQGHTSLLHRKPHSRLRVQFRQNKI